MHANIFFSAIQYEFSKFSVATLCVFGEGGGGVEVSEPTENFVGKQDEGQKFVVHYWEPICKNLLKGRKEKNNRLQW